MKPNNLWFAIVDGEHARFVSLEENASMGHPVFAKKSIIPPDGFRHPPAVRTLWALDAVIRPEPMPANKDRTKPRQPEPDHFIESVASELGARHEQFDELIIVAKPDACKRLERWMHNGTKNKIAGFVRKNLTNVPEQALLPHLRQYAQRGKR